MSLGSTAYESYVRIHVEMGKPDILSWESIPHMRRMAWEAAAQAVAREILPTSFTSDSSDFDEEELDEADN